MHIFRLKSLAFPLTLLSFTACGPEGALVDPHEATEEKQPFSSVEATLLELSFNGELVTSNTWNLESVVEDQMLYTIGQLNGSRAVGRLDRLELSITGRTRLGDGTTRVSYHAVLPVAWGKKTNLPTSYDFILPRRIDALSLDAFSDKYKATCVDAGAHDVDSGSFWYYYRPSRSGCSLDGADIARFSASISVSAENTDGKYPEYHKVWEDQTLSVVAIFGKYEDGATEASDAGISAFNSFVSRMRSAFSGITTEPANVPSSPGVASPDITFRATLAGGRSLRVHALLVDNVRTAGPAFDQRYEDLSTEADLIAYNGHAGLGSNVRALAGKGSFRTGKYQIFFMNGCDTFAYVDGALAQARARLNADDPSGTKYMDIITNGMPSYFSSNAGNDMALINGLLKLDAPMSYQAIFRGFARDQVVLVTGEEDNVFVPGYDPGGGGGGTWSGLRETGTVVKNEARRFATPQLPAGTYRFDLSGSGDADLYVRAGAEPTASTFDCRPYSGSSNESCTIVLTAPEVIHVMVEGYAPTSQFTLVGSGAGGGGGGGSWSGLQDSGTVTKDQELRWQTAPLPSGRYRFTTTGTDDADLYVRIGAAPSTVTYTCRSYGPDSNESCTVTLTSEAVIHVMVRGYAQSSSYTLTGTRI